MNYEENEKMLDCKQLFYYVVKQWKQILLCLMVGILLGSVFSFIRGQKTVDDLSDAERKTLNIEKIHQYHRVQQLYELQLENNAKSVILQLDPNQVYRANRSYYLTIPAIDASLISERYAMIMADTAFLDELIAASGLDCSHRAIKELVGLSFSKAEQPATVWRSYGLLPQYAKVSLSVIAPDEGTGEALLDTLDAHVIALQDTLSQESSAFTYRKLNESNQFGYDSGVRSTQEAASNTIKSYENEIVALKKVLTNEDMFYYAWTYHAADIQFSLLKQTVRYAFMFGALFCMAACAWYSLKFLLDDHIKTTQEITEYSLYTIACLESGVSPKQDIIDRIFADGNLPANSKEYTLNALHALCTGQTVLCGDKQDASTAELMEWLASQMDRLCVTDMLAKDENGLISIKESEGAILFIRLWKTTTYDLKRELSIMKQLEKPVMGVVVLRG